MFRVSFSTKIGLDLGWSFWTSGRYSEVFVSTAVVIKIPNFITVTINIDHTILPSYSEYSQTCVERPSRGPKNSGRY
jgi:hypothetical protein